MPSKNDAQKVQVLQPAAGGPLLSWLLEVLRPMPRARIKQLLQHGRISVNGAVTTRFDFALQPHDRVAVLQSQKGATGSLGPASGIVFMDDDLLVIDKPAGLLSVATPSEGIHTAFAKLNALMREQGMGRPFVVHRLDRETSGLLLFARSARVRDQLQANWDSVAKTYLAVVEGTPRPPEAVVENYLAEGRDMRVRASGAGRGKRAITRYRVVRTKDARALVEVELETGRKHQIRVHLAGLGCPVIGDKVYGAKTNPARRLGLHAWKLSLDHPITGQRLEWESPLPAVLRRVVE